MSKNKKTLGEVGRKPSLADVDLDKVKPTDVVLELDEILKDSKRLLYMFFNNEFEPAVEGCQLYSETSIMHALAMSALHFLKMVLTMSKVQMDVASVQVAKSISKIEAHRHERSYKNLLIKPNYNNFNDTQCLAEITFVLANLVYGTLIALRDQSVLGIINAGYKMNIAYRSLNECANIKKYKTNWVLEEAKEDFYSVYNLTQGGFEIILSMFPAKLAKLLEYIGFNCNQKHALELIEQSCYKIDVITYHVSSFILTACYGLVEFIYGLGDKKLDVLNKYCQIWSKRCPDGAFTHLVTGITEMNKANFNVSIHCFRRVIEEQDYWPQLHFLAHMLLCLCYSIIDDYDKALQSAAKLRDKCKWSSSLFYYLHCSFLQAKIKYYPAEMTPKEIKETEKLISEQLLQVPKLKRKLGGIHVFHEELSITRAKKYHDKLDEFVMPGLEFLYFWNIYSMMRDNPNLIEMKLKLTNEELQKTEKDEKGNPKNEEILNYLLFHKAILLRHLNKSDETEKILNDVIKKEKIVKFNNYIIAGSWFELALIRYDQGDLKECKKFLKKANNYSHYLGEGLITYRIGLMQDKIKNSKINSEKKS